MSQHSDDLERDNSIEMYTCLDGRTRQARMLKRKYGSSWRSIATKDELIPQKTMHNIFTSSFSKPLISFERTSSSIDKSPISQKLFPSSRNSQQSVYYSSKCEPSGIVGDKNSSIITKTIAPELNSKHEEVFICVEKLLKAKDLRDAYAQRRYRAIAKRRGVDVFGKHASHRVDTELLLRSLETRDAPAFSAKEITEAAHLMNAQLRITSRKANLEERVWNARILNLMNGSGMMTRTMQRKLEVKINAIHRAQRGSDSNVVLNWLCCRFEGLLAASKGYSKGLTSSTRS